MYSLLQIGHIVSLAIFIFVAFVLVRASFVSGSRVPVRFKKRLYNGIMVGTISIIALLAYSQGQKQLDFHSRLTAIAAQYDSRIWLRERSIRKGTIFDRTGDPDRALAVSVRNDAQEMIRSYPFGRYSGHIVGYSDRERGRAGIEAAFHATLLGMQFGYVENAKRYVLGRIASDVPRGSDVYLTIDSKLQAAAYESLENRKGAVVVLDPRSGEILALVSSPGFSPNDVRSEQRWRDLIDQEDDAPLFNRALNGLYPPGSVMKIVVAAAALESGIDPVYYSGPDGFKPGNGAKTIHEHEYDYYMKSGKKWTGHGNLTMDKAMRKSSNVYFARLSLALKRDAFDDVLRRFGFNNDVRWNTSSIGLKEQFVVTKSQAPVMKKLSVPEQICWSALGQYKILISPLHAALITAAIANDGSRPMPSLELGRFPRFSLKAISPATAKKLRKMLRNTVSRGTGFRAQVPGLEIAGKIGTAEIGLQDPHSWFVSFAPVDDARLVVVVVVENGGFGGQAAAVAARRIYTAAKILGYFNKFSIL